MIGSLFFCRGTTRLCRRLTAHTQPIDLEATNLDADEWSSDISNVTSVMKLWLRELPEPLFTMPLHQGFLDAASKRPHPYSLDDALTDRSTGLIRTGIENDRLRHIRLHERVNDLPDANYATLKYFLGHLHRYGSTQKDRITGCT